MKADYKKERIIIVRTIDVDESEYIAINYYSAGVVQSRITNDLATSI